MNPETRERLVAHLLGESSADESAALERELARLDDVGEELRAERDRLASTIGLVRAFGGESRGLSDVQQAEVARVATSQTPSAPVIPFRRRRALAAAAAILLATGASAVWFGSRPMGGALWGGDEVARGEAVPGDALAPRMDLAAGGEAEARLVFEAPAGGADAFSTSGYGFDPQRENGLAGLTDTLSLDPGAFESSVQGPTGGFFLGSIEAPGAPAGSVPAPTPGGTWDESRGVFERLGYGGGASGAPTLGQDPQTFGGGGGGPPPTTGGPLGQQPESPSGPATPPSRGAVPAGSKASVQSEVNELSASTGLDDKGVVDVRRALEEQVVEAEDALVDHLGFREALLEELVEYDRGDFDEEQKKGLPSWAGDFDAMRAFEQKKLLESGLEPNDKGLRSLLEALGHLAPNSNEPLDSAAVLDVRWRLFGRGVLEERLKAVLEDCRRRPAESLADMYFRHWGTRPFERAATDPVSTFAADVDTSSYTLARAMLDSGVMPSPDQIRVEEWINYFDAELAAPTNGTFAVTAQLAPNPFDAARLGEPTWLMRVGVQGRVVEDYERSGLALTFVVDTSGSMAQGERSELVKNALMQLLTKLDERDTLAIVAFSNTAQIVLEPTPATQRGRIEAAITSLGAAGGTNVEGGLVLGYELAARGHDLERENRVVLLSDGVGNIGETDQVRILERVEASRNNRILLNTIGVGLGNHNDTFLEQLADRGDGVADYVDSPLEARRAFVERFTGAFQTIARDVKIQVEFDPNVVREYRLVGYENRAVADRSFRDDTVDGGEVGAGHSVVALYELRGVQFDVSNRVPNDQSLATVRVRWLPPSSGADTGTASELAEPVTGAMATWNFDAAPVALRKNVLVARVAEILKRSAHVRRDSLEVLAAAIERASNESPEIEFRSFAGLFARNRAAIEALVRPPSPVEGLVDELRHVRYELEVERTAPGTPDANKVAALEARVAELENEVRRMVLGDVASAAAPAPSTPAPAPAPAPDDEKR
jgi:Ca-activated chloride channel family protein